jgi:hypothetical protein
VRSSLRSFEGKAASLVFMVLPAFAPGRADLKRIAPDKIDPGEIDRPPFVPIF